MKKSRKMEERPTIIASRLVEISPLVDILAEQSPSSELLVTPSSKGYLSHLATLPLTELLQEPISLQTQSHHLTSSLTSLTHTSYPTFISLHKTTTALTSSLESLSSSLDNLLDSSLPALEESTTVWKTRIEAVLCERNKAKVVLDQHEKIRDLLDIPVLIDTCVRNGYFGEALSLASHVTTLTSSFHKDSDKANDDNVLPPAILTSVLSEVQHSITQMHLSLLATLHEPNRKLPALWKAVNFLRRMDAFGASPAHTSFALQKPLSPTHQPAPIRAQCEEPSSEEQLALAFLIGRESCLKAILEPSGRDIQRLVKQVAASETGNGVEDGGREGKLQGKGGSKGKGKELDDREKEDMARYLKRYIDLWRESAYDIITQYATIFLERSSTSTTEAPGSHRDEDQLSRLHTLLRTYSSRALTTHLFAMLKPSLPLLSLSHLPSFLTQLNYCSTAFARLGLDFRCILLGGGGIFSFAILEVVKRDFTRATNTWIGRVEKARGEPIRNNVRTTPASSSRITATAAELPSKWLILPSFITSPPLPPPSKHVPSGPPHIPPQILASYPPIAELTNAVLGVLNGLRLVVPRSSQPTGATVNGDAAGVSGTADVEWSAEGVNQLLKMLDEIVLGQGAAALLDYLMVVVASLVSEDSVDSEKERERERERNVAVAGGRVFFEVFGPFLRRALVEGVYGMKIKDTVPIEGWSKWETDFARLLKGLGEEEDEEEEDDDAEGSEEE